MSEIIEKYVNTLKKWGITISNEEIEKIKWWNIDTSTNSIFKKFEKEILEENSKIQSDDKDEKKYKWFGNTPYALSTINQYIQIGIFFSIFEESIATDLIEAKTINDLPTRLSKYNQIEYIEDFNTVSNMVENFKNNIGSTSCSSKIREQFFKFFFSWFLYDYFIIKENDKSELTSILERYSQTKETISDIGAFKDSFWHDRKLIKNIFSYNEKITPSEVGFPIEEEPGTKTKFIARDYHKNDNIGFIGERIVQDFLTKASLEYLKKHKGILSGISNLTWIWENINGESGEKFDFSTKDSDLTQKYLEVKTTVTNVNEFNLSEGEKIFWNKHMENTFLIFIKNLNIKKIPFNLSDDNITKESISKDWQTIVDYLEFEIQLHPLETKYDDLKFEVTNYKVVIS